MLLRLNILMKKDIERKSNVDLIWEKEIYINLRNFMQKKYIGDFGFMYGYYVRK